MSDDLKDEVERLRAENERLKNQRASGLSFKVSEKGAVSVYGLGRFPVTLYKEQWMRVLANTPRPHRALALTPPHPRRTGHPDWSGARIQRRDRLGGVIHEYDLAA